MGASAQTVGGRKGGGAKNQSILLGEIEKQGPLPVTKKRSSSPDLSVTQQQAGRGQIGREGVDWRWGGGGWGARGWGVTVDGGGVK